MMTSEIFKGGGMCRRKSRSGGFTLIELIVVVGIIIVVTGISIPLINKFFENRRMPRAAKILATHVKNAHITAVNYMMETQIEIAPNTENKLRIWGFSAQVANPSTWDSGGKVMVTEARRLSKRGGEIRFIPLNRYSLQPQNSYGYKNLSGWEFCELHYKNYAMQACYKVADGADLSEEWREWEVTPEIMNLTYSHSQNGRGGSIGGSRPVGMQVLLSTAFLPSGTGIDPVNYVSYYDANKDGMPDGNPLGLRWNPNSGENNHIVPLVVPAFGDTVVMDHIFRNQEKRIPQKVSGSLSFSRSGTLKRSLSLNYLAADPLNMGNKYFTSGTTIDAARVYGFVVYDKSSPLRRMMVEVTGIGQVRRPYGIFTPNEEAWGTNFDPATETGS